jgi:hypothetical protein
MSEAFQDIAKKRYDELLKQREEIDKEIQPLKKYLMNVGVLKKQTRGRKPKKAV